MTVEEYKEVYCTYCDSQRCLNRIGETLEHVCPYWAARQEERDGVKEL